MGDGDPPLKDWSTYSCFKAGSNGRGRAHVNFMQAPARHAGVELPPAAAWLLPVVALLALTFVNPVGYMGGGGDDWHYLQSARCAVREGLCLPGTHWEARFPLVLPMSLAMRLLGESAASVQLVPLLYALAGLILFSLNVRRRFGTAAAAIAGIVLAATPAISMHALQPMVDGVEFAWCMAALLAGQLALERRSRSIAALAGACLAFAIFSRTTSVVMVPVFGLIWLQLPRDARRLALPFCAGMAAVFAAEAAAYWIAAGDPFYSWRLMLRHARIPSTELASWVDTTKSPLLNPDFIAGWRPSMGIHVHWSIDAVLNLLADPKCGLTLSGALGLALVYRDAWRADRLLISLGGYAALHFVVLIYVLAVDPKPRMFWIEFASAAVVIAVITTRAWQTGRRLLPLALLALILARSLLLSYDRPNPGNMAAAADVWISRLGPGNIATDEWTRRTLALVPGVAALPLRDEAARRYRLVLAERACPPGRIIAAQTWARDEWAPFAWARDHALFIGPRLEPVLCVTDRG